MNWNNDIFKIIFTSIPIQSGKLLWKFNIEKSNFLPKESIYACFI
ncbi:hypothetical protein LEP1GSC188_0409 [Leptospira weilii serovar Topaz str. LT2116]|uniref:Uncharacterized protein n=1 Tax=Leptospira weilii serovar Topaz str. LT2116 TaxID=1088540 RepID=M3EFS4_9LEPT|nr:hypothetical protein LEP1GSC188_0409 [Leptospira weilii serovar Topaz str. LT2116]